MRAVHRAAVGEGGHRLRELDRRVRVVALADADRDGLAGVPLLLLGPLEALHLPFRRGQHAGGLALQVDAGALAEAEMLHEAGDGVDPEVVRHLVVVGVRGHDDRLVEVDHAVAAGPGVAEAPAAEVEVARVVDRAARRALAELERGQRHERLEGRARRVHAGNGAVVEGLVDGVVELGPALRIDTVDEQVRVEPRLRDEGEHAAALRLDRHQRAAALAERILGDPLQRHVERERDVIARLRGRARQRADAAPRGIDLDVLEAGSAVQLVLVARLDPRLADVIGAAVIRVDAVLLEARLVGLVDAAHVAEGVRGDIAVGILAEQPPLDLHALEAIAVRGKLGHFLVAEASADRQALGVARLRHQLLEQSAVARRDLDQLGELVDRAFDAPHPAREDLQRVA